MLRPFLLKLKTKNMNDIKLKPFDLQKAISGEPVIMRNGEPYKFAAYNPDAGKHEKILGWHKNGYHLTHSANGRYAFEHDIDHGFDLFMAPQEKELWIAVNNKANITGHYFTSFAFENKDNLMGHVDTDECQIIKITIQQ